MFPSSSRPILPLLRLSPNLVGAQDSSRAWRSLCACVITEETGVGHCDRCSAVVFPACSDCSHNQQVLLCVKGKTTTISRLGLNLPIHQPLSLTSTQQYLQLLLPQRILLSYSPRKYSSRPQAPVCPSSPENQSTSARFFLFKDCLPSSFKRFD